MEDLNRANHFIADLASRGVAPHVGCPHLVFGQDFSGNYGPGTSGIYTRQVRSFTIVDDGTELGLSFDDMVASTPLPEFRRRDLNVFPVIRPDGVGGLRQGIVVLSGVFTPPPDDGAWTVPVEIRPDGLNVVTHMDDPNAPDTFKQGFNGYHSAKLGLFSEATGAMHEILFGGISLQTLDTSTQTVITDDNLPFINDITSVVLAGILHLLASPPASNMVSRAAYLAEGLGAGVVDERASPPAGR